jgi:phytoene synthase
MIRPTTRTTTDLNDPVCRASHEHCARVTKTSAKNFYHGLRLARPEHRRGLYAVYAWMRAADDLADADAPVQSRLESLAEFEAETRAMFDGEPVSPEAFWPALADTVARFPIEPGELIRLLDGMRWDLEVGSCTTDADLVWYCSCVASTVGLICTSIWGVRTPEAIDESRRLAYLRGQAFQLTNILRDLREDLTHPHQPRCYLPAESYEVFGITPLELLAWSRPDACAAFFHHWVDRARLEYRRSRNYELTIAPAGLAASTAMRDIYRELLEQIARDPRAAVQSRVSVPTSRKVVLALKTAKSFGL